MKIKPDLLSKRTWTVALVATIGLGLWLWVIDQHLRNPTAPFGIVSFEFAFTTTTTQAILDSWRGAAWSKAWASMAVDVFFPAAYATFIASSIARVRIGLPQDGWSARMAARLIPAAGLAAASDYVENAGLCYGLLFGSNSIAALVAGVFASIKTALLAAMIAYLLGVGCVKLSASRQA